MLNFQRFKSAFNLVREFIQCFEHAECIAIDKFNLLCWALSD